MANWFSFGAGRKGSQGDVPTGKALLRRAARAEKKGESSVAGVEGSTPRRVTVPLELTLAVKERRRAQLEERRTSAAMSEKVAALVSRSGWEAWVCLGA